MENTDQQVAEILLAIQAATPEVAEQAVSAYMIEAVAWIIMAGLLMPLGVWLCRKCSGWGKVTGDDIFYLVAGIAGCVSFLCGVICAIQTVGIIQAVYAPQYIATKLMLEMCGL